MAEKFTYEAKKFSRMAEKLSHMDEKLSHMDEKISQYTGLMWWGTAIQHKISALTIGVRRRSLCHYGWAQCGFI